MNIAFRQLSPEDGPDVYDMLQEIPKGENGFVNGCHGKSFEAFKQWLRTSDDMSKGIGLEDWMVPQSTYWLLVDGKPVGMGKLRHRLTDHLKAAGGHIGYAIRPTCRNQGYGKVLLGFIIEAAGALGLDRLLITIHNHNVPSIKVALSQGGQTVKVDEQRHFIEINC